MLAVDGTVTVDGGHLWYERAGEGFPVVLIHAGLWDARIWDPQFEAFAEYHDVVRYDLRGSGRSSRPAEPYSDLRDLEVLLGSLWIDRCALVGCGAGAQLALDFTLLHPSTAEALVLVSPDVTGYRWKDPGLEILEQEIRDALAEGDDRRALEVQLAVWAPYTAGDPEGAARRIAFDNVAALRIDASLATPPPPAIDRLGDVHAATMVVVGDRDIEETHVIADLVSAEIPGASKRVVAEADVLVNVARPDRFNRLVLDFLSFRT